MSPLWAERARTSSALREHLTPEEAEAVLAAARPALELSVDADAGEPLGCSYFGGGPLLPPSVEWPHHGDAPLDFLAAVDLSAAHRTEACLGLPTGGVLNFFYAGRESDITGLETCEADGWRVIRAEESTAVETPAPEGAAQSTRRRVHARPLLILPHLEAVTGEQIHEIPSAHFNAYEAADPSPSAHHVPRHLLSGWPDVVQVPFWEQCALVSSGFAWDADIDAAGVEAGEWRLLLQLDTDGAMDEEWDWGDTGRLFFAIRERDLLAGDFTRVWMALQDT